MRTTLQSLHDILKSKAILPDNLPGSLEFIQKLLLEAGIESNPGPQSPIPKDCNGKNTKIVTFIV